MDILKELQKKIEIQKEINKELVDESEKLKSENAKLRKLLKSAVEDMKKVTTNVAFEGLVCGGECVHFGDCERVKNNDDKMYRCRTFKWRHADEVAEVLKDE